VPERLRLPAVLIHGDMVPSRPPALRHLWQPREQAPDRSPAPAPPRHVVRPDFDARDRRATS
jgi:hypothetical protein